MPCILEAKPYFLVVPSKFPAECPNPDNPLKVKGWTSEAKFYGHFTKGLELFQQRNKNLGIVYFHGLIYAGLEGDELQSGDGVKLIRPSCNTDNRDAEQLLVLDSEEYEADGVVFVYDIQTGNQIV